MQEDRQPNETRLQHKGDHRVPRVWPSANPQQQQKGRSRHKKPKPRNRACDASPQTTSDSLSVGQGSKRRQRWRLKSLRNVNRAGDKPTAPSLLAVDFTTKSANDSCTGSSPIPLASSSLPKLCPRPPTTSDPSRYRQPKLAADDQKNRFDPHQLVNEGQGSDSHRLSLGQQPPPIPTGYWSHHPGFLKTEIPFRGDMYSGDNLRGAIPRTAPPPYQEINDQSSAKCPKHEPPAPRPTPTAMPQTSHRGRSLKQDSNDIIDPTLDSSYAELFDTLLDMSPGEFSSANVSGDPLSVRHSPCVPAPPPPEGTSSDDFIHGFSTGPAILDPALNLAKEPHDKPRLFVRYTLDFQPCLVNISARGFVDKISMGPRWGREKVRSPGNPASEFVDDACVLNAYGSALLVLAHGREHDTVTIHRLSYWSPTHRVGSYDRPVAPGGPKGLTAICAMMQPLSFATGGADHGIHIWNIDHDLQITRSERPLAIRHSSLIYSLLPIQDSSHKLVSSGADCNVNVYDLSSEQVVKTVKLSNPGFRVHNSGNPSTLLIQTAHREHQFEIRDLRESSANIAEETFGFTSDSLRLSRFSRGDVAHSILFACGDLEGRVHIWDLRNVKRPASQVKCFQTEIKNVTWHESHILASSGDNRIAAIPYTHAN